MAVLTFSVCSTRNVLYHVLYEAVVKPPDLLRNYGSGVGIQNDNHSIPCGVTGGAETLYCIA